MEGHYHETKTYVRCSLELCAPDPCYCYWFFLQWDAVFHFFSATLYEGLVSPRDAIRMSRATSLDENRRFCCGTYAHGFFLCQGVCHGTNFKSLAQIFFAWHNIFCFSTYKCKIFYQNTKFLGHQSRRQQKILLRYVCHCVIVPGHILSGDTNSTSNMIVWCAIGDTLSGLFCRGVILSGLFCPRDILSVHGLKQGWCNYFFQQLVVATTHYFLGSTYS